MTIINTTTEFNFSSFENTTRQYEFISAEKMELLLFLIIITLTFVTMLSLGCTMEISKIKKHLIKPKGVVTAIVAQYGIMPFTAFCLAKLLHLGPVESVTVLVCGCCPGGTSSNIMALALQGDMNLSIVMTTFSTLLGLGMMPLMIYLYSQGIRNLKNAIPYTGIIMSLITVLIPCGLGILINYRVPKYSKTIIKVGLFLTAIIFVILFTVGGIKEDKGFIQVTTPSLLASAMLMPLCGYICGYFLSALFRMNASCRRTVAVETGCQNINLGMAVLKVVFPAEVIGQLYLFPVIYFVFQLAEAFIFIVVFRCHQRWRSSSKNETKAYIEVKKEAEDNKGPSDNVCQSTA